MRSLKFKSLKANCIAAIRKNRITDPQDIWNFARGFIEGARTEKWNSADTVEFADSVHNAMHSAEVNENPAYTRI